MRPQETDTFKASGALARVRTTVNVENDRGHERAATHDLPPGNAQNSDTFRGPLDPANEASKRSQTDRVPQRPASNGPTVLRGRPPSANTHHLILLGGKKNPAGSQRRSNLSSPSRIRAAEMCKVTLADLLHRTSCRRASEYPHCRRLQRVLSK